MSKTHRLWMTGAAIVGFVIAHGNATIFASGDPTSSTSDTQLSASGELAPPVEHPRFTLDAGFLAANPSLGFPAQDARLTFAGQIRQGRPYRYGDRNRSIAFLTVGTIGAITGAAILVYANRPECNTNQFAGGCGYGTKVIGGAVLTGGAVGLTIGALTW